MSDTLIGSSAAARGYAEVTSRFPQASLDDLLSLRNGLNFTQASSGEAVKVLGVGDFLQHARLRDFASLPLVKVDGALSSDDFLKDGDLVFVRSNGSRHLIGRCAMVYPGEEKISFSGFTIRARIKDRRVEPDFLLAVLRSDFFRRALHKNGTGSYITNLSQELLSKIHIPLPDPSEQRRVAAILNCWDDALNALDRLIELRLLALNSARASQLYHRRVDAHGHGRWTEVCLRDVLHEHGLKSTAKEPVFSVSVHRGLVDQIEHLGRSFAAADTSQYNRVLPGDIVYTKSPTGDFPLGVLKQNLSGRTVIVSPLYGVFTPKTPALGFLIDRIFASPIAAKNYLTPLVQRGPKNTMSITNAQFLSGTLVLPLDVNTQMELAAFFEDGLAEIDALRREREATQRQKRGLMQKLLTGEWRTEAEAAA